MDSAVVRSSAAKNSPVPPGFCTSKKLIHLNLTSKRPSSTISHSPSKKIQFVSVRGTRTPTPSSLPIRISLHGRSFSKRSLCRRVPFPWYFGLYQSGRFFNCFEEHTAKGISLNDRYISLVLNRSIQSQKENFTFQNGSTVVFKRIQIAQITIEGGMEYSESFGSTAKSMYKNAANNELVTDGEITGDAGEKQLFGRKLQAASSWLDPTLDTADLEDTFQRRNSQSVSKSLCDVSIAEGLSCRPIGTNLRQMKSCLALFPRSMRIYIQQNWIEKKFHPSNSLPRNELLAKSNIKHRVITICKRNEDTCQKARNTTKKRDTVRWIEMHPNACPIP